MAETKEFDLQQLVGEKTLEDFQTYVSLTDYRNLVMNASDDVYTYSWGYHE